MSQARTGFVAGVAAYLLWGLFPLYWPLLEPAKPVEILAHRIVWSVVVLAVVLLATTGFRWARHLGRRGVRRITPNCPHAATEPKCRRHLDRSNW